MNATRWLVIALLFACGLRAFAQSDIDPSSDDHDSAAILELGGAASWDVPGGTGSYGPDVAVEVTPIENWLELESGFAALFNRHSSEWGVDLLFKKPWTLSKRAELMIGVGPEWVHSRENGIARNALAGEAVIDFMFWPGGKHRFGWFVEPAYEYTFGHEHEKSFGISAGLLIAIR